MKLVTSDAHAGPSPPSEQPCLCILATLPYPPRGKSDVHDPEDLLALGKGSAALGLRPVNPRSPTADRCCGGFPNRTSLIWLTDAVLASQHNEWIESRRYFGLDLIQRSQAVGTIPYA